MRLTNPNVSRIFHIHIKKFRPTAKPQQIPIPAHPKLTGAKLTYIKPRASIKPPSTASPAHSKPSGAILTYMKPKASTKPPPAPPKPPPAPPAHEKSSGAAQAACVFWGRLQSREKLLTHQRPAGRGRRRTASPEPEAHQSMFENCFLQDVRHSLRRICFKSRGRSGLR